MRIMSKISIALHADKMSSASTQISTIGFVVDTVNFTLSFLSESQLDKRRALYLNGLESQ